MAEAKFYVLQWQWGMIIMREMIKVILNDLILETDGQ